MHFFSSGCSFHLHLRTRTVAITKWTVTPALKLSWTPRPSPWPLGMWDSILIITTALVRCANCNTSPALLNLLGLWTISCGPFESTAQCTDQTCYFSVAHRHHSVPLWIISLFLLAAAGSRLSSWSNCWLHFNKKISDSLELHNGGFMP